MIHTITRQAALIEINGEVLVLKLSANGWAQVLQIAAKEGAGELIAAPAPNQAVIDLISKPTIAATQSPDGLVQLAERVAGLNASAGEIGAGMLAQLVQQANTVLAELHPTT